MTNVAAPWTNWWIQPDAIEQIVGNGTFALLIKIAAAVIIISLLLMFSKYIAAVVRKNILRSAGEDKEHSHADQIANLVGDIVFYSLAIFSVFVGFEILGFDVWLILWGVTFGVWLAFKEVLGNMIAGIMILTTKEIKLGDIIYIDGPDKYFGKIEEISIRYTIIRTFDLKQVVIPNLTLITVPIMTYSAEEMVRLETTIQVHYDTDIDFALSVVRTALQSCSFITDQSKNLLTVENFWSSGIDINIKFHINPQSGMLIEQAIWLVNQTVVNYFRANKIEIPYPHANVIIESDNRHTIPRWIPAMT